MKTEVVSTKDIKNLGPVFGQLSFQDHEQIVFCNDKDTGLKAIIGIHDTTLGPALGGTRMWQYNNEQDALNDVLRLSRGMSFKSAITGLEPRWRKSCYYWRCQNTEDTRTYVEIW